MVHLPPVAIAFLLAQYPAAAPPPAVITAERAWAGPDVLLPLAHSPDSATAIAALRALGRLQDRALVQPLLDVENSGPPPVRDAAASALAQTLITANPGTDGALLSTVIDRMVQHQEWSAAAVLAMPDAQHASAVEGLIDDVLKRTTADPRSPDRERAVRAFESLARRNARLTGFSLRPDSVALLERAGVTHESDESPVIRRYAFWTLVQARAATASALAAALQNSDDQTRRIAVQALGANNAVLAPAERINALRRALKDSSIIVRFEAVRSYARQAATADCTPLVGALHDDAAHVVNGALDALATACSGDISVTDRLAKEAVRPPPSGPWQRSAHALLALAARDPSRAAAVLPAFAGHPVWEVRMYAARAAATLKDEATLARLAMDASDNVRSTALSPLHQLSPERARPAVLAALERADYQVLRTAATALAADPPSRTAADALAAALQRVSEEHKQTSRDARIPLLDALAKHGTEANAGALLPMLTDIDPLVAARAAAVLRGWGRTATPSPVILHRDPRPAFADASTCVAIEMANGRRMRLQPDAGAPVTVEAFLHLALDRRSYDGRTFHRVEPDFVIQGGSPGANEYSSGLDTFLRDEIGAANVRGGVGLSTRGADTGDGQIYILLVDEPRLDGRYTIFAHVFDTAEDMGVLDGVQEGDRIARITRVSCPQPH